MPALEITTSNTNLLQSVQRTDRRRGRHEGAAGSQDSEACHSVATRRGTRTIPRPEPEDHCGFNNARFLSDITWSCHGHGYAVLQERENKTAQTRLSLRHLLRVGKGWAINLVVPWRVKRDRSSHVSAVFRKVWGVLYCTVRFSSSCLAI